MSSPDSVRIGGASGAWGDSPRAVGQLLEADVDFLMMDYLAEVTMSLLARARDKAPQAGFVPDMVAYLAPHLPAIAEKGVRVVANGGGLNPLAARDALREAAGQAGLDLTVAAVLGDDLMPYLQQLSNAQLRTETGEPIPPDLLTANAYLGARPIRAALKSGADIVVTGRCADSAMALGILMHTFDWPLDSYDLLAAGSLVGHVIECGPQATGGNFTDWWEVPDWHNIGYPIAECRADGTFELSKPAGTGGLIDPRCVTEQILYELGDPANYILPDVIADFSNVQVARRDVDHVLVRGATGRPPTSTYKVSATRHQGYKAVTTVSIVGPRAPEKAQRTGEQFLLRGREILAAHALPDFTDWRLDVLGADSSYGTKPSGSPAREVILRLVTTHTSREALALVAREVGSIGLSMAPGITGLMGGRPRPTPQLVLSTLFLEKSAAPDVHVATPEATITLDEPVDLGRDPAEDASLATQRTTNRDAAATDMPPAASPDVRTVPLGALAHARSGDKGDNANIAIIARRPEYLPIIREQVTPERLAAHFRDLVSGPVECLDAPGLHALNFLLHDALGGGGIASLRIDPQGKAYGQMALELTMEVPAALITAVGGAGGRPISG